MTNQVHCNCQSKVEIRPCFSDDLEKRVNLAADKLMVKLKNENSVSEILSQKASKFKVSTVAEISPKKISKILLYLQKKFQKKASMLLSKR